MNVVSYILLTLTGKVLAHATTCHEGYSMYTGYCNAFNPLYINVMGMNLFGIRDYTLPVNIRKAFYKGEDRYAVCTLQTCALRFS